MDALKVAARLRPLSERERSSGLTSTWLCTEKSVYQSNQNSTCFYFDHVFGPESSNRDVYDHLVQNIVSNAMEGFHGTLMTYGQSGSGKTYTVDALASMAFDNIYDHIENSPDRQYLVRVSYMELYNEKLSDLFSTQETTLMIREDVERNIWMEGLIEEAIRCKEDALNLLSKGNEKRRFAETKLNDRSSRAHCIVRIVIESRNREEAEDSSVFVSHLHIVDLAGSEKTRENADDRFREGCAINKSLLALSQVIRKLSEGQSNIHIGYRDSKLTRILQNALGGNSRTAIICTISPCSVEETVSTLRFAMNAKKVHNKPQQNEILSDSAVMLKYQKEIKRLNKKITELEHAPSQSIELDKKRQEVDHLKSLLLVSSKEPSREIENRIQRRRETVCVPRMFRYNPPPGIKALPRTPNLKVSTLTSSMIDQPQLLQQQLRFESPFPVSPVHQDLSFNEYEKTFVNEHVQAAVKRLRKENRELRIKLKELSNSSRINSCIKSKREHEETQEYFDDACNISSLVERNQSHCLASNITQRSERKGHSYTPIHRTHSQEDLQEDILNSDEDSHVKHVSFAISDPSKEGDWHETLYDCSLLMDQSQPLMDASIMCLNQSLLPKASRVDKGNEEADEGNSLNPRRLFDSFEKEKEFIVQFESLVKEKEHLVQQIFKLEQQLKIASANLILADERSLEGRNDNSEPGKDSLNDGNAATVDIAELGEIERRRREMAAEKEEIARKAEDLKVQEERIERKIDSLCEKEETIEEKLDVLEAKEREVTDKESNFLRLELELTKRKRDFERICNEEGKTHEFVCQDSIVGTEPVNIDVYEMETSNISEVEQNMFNEKKITDDKCKICKGRQNFDQIMEDLIMQKEEMEKEKRVLSENKAIFEVEKLDICKEKDAIEEKCRDLERKLQEIHTDKEKVDEVEMKCQQIMKEHERQKDGLHSQQLDVGETKRKYEELNILLEEKNNKLQMEIDELKLKEENFEMMETDLEKQRHDLIQERKHLEEMATDLARQEDEVNWSRDKLAEENQEDIKNMSSYKTGKLDLDRQRADMEADFEKRMEEIQYEKQEMKKREKKYQEIMTEYESQKTGDKCEMCEDRLKLEQMTADLIMQKEDLEKGQRILSENQDIFEMEKIDLCIERGEMEKKLQDFTEVSSELERMKHEKQKERDQTDENQMESIRKTSSFETEKFDLDRQRADLEAEFEKRMEEIQYEKLEMEKREKKCQEMMTEYESQKTGDKCEMCEDRLKLEQMTADLIMQKEDLDKGQRILSENQAIFEMEKIDLCIERGEMEKKLQDFTQMSSELEKMKHEKQKERDQTDENHSIQKTSSFETEKFDLDRQRADLEAEFEKRMEEIQYEKQKMEKREKKCQEMMTEYESQKTGDKCEMCEDRLKLEQMTADLIIQKEDLEKDQRILSENQAIFEMEKIDLCKERGEIEKDLQHLTQMSSELERLKHEKQKERDQTDENQMESIQKTSSFETEEFDLDRQRADLEAEFEKRMEEIQYEKLEMEKREKKCQEMMTEYESQKTGDKCEMCEDRLKLEQMTADLIMQKEDLEKDQRILSENQAIFEMEKIDLCKERDEMENKLQDFTQLSSELEGMKHEIHDEKEQIQENWAKLQERSSLNETEKFNIEKERADMVAEFERSMEEIHTEKQRLREREQQCQELMIQYESEKDVLNTQQLEVEETKRKLEEMSTSIEEKKNNLQTEIQDLEMQKDDLIDERKYLEEVAADLARHDEEICRKREELEIEAKKLTTKIDSQSKEESQEPSDQPSRQEALDRIAHLKLVIEKGKSMLCQRGQQLGETQASNDALQKQIMKLKEEKSNLEAKYAADSHEYEKITQRLKIEKERVEKEAEKVKRDGSSKTEVNTLKAQLRILEKEKHKLEIKNQEDIEYYELALEKYKRQIRQNTQDLGASFIEPPNTSTRSEVQSSQELKQTKQQYKEMQAKYTSEIVQLKQTIQLMRDEKDQGERKPLHNIQQEQRPPPMVTSGGIVDYVVSLNKDREIRRLKKQLEKCHCMTESS